MNDFAETKAFAKVNLTLDVLKKRADGYHELSTIMQTIDLYDELYADFSHEDIAVTADFDLPEGSVAYRAAHEYARRTGCGGAHIKIRAHIPEMAGLGGSSADGAGVLRLMQRRYGAMSGAELYSLAAELGSDVPFLLHGATALCRGRGERIEPLPDINLCYLIVKPAEGISTRQLFSAIWRGQKRTGSGGNSRWRYGCACGGGIERACKGGRKGAWQHSRNKAAA